MRRAVRQARVGLGEPQFIKYELRLGYENDDAAFSFVHGWLDFCSPAYWVNKLYESLPGRLRPQNN